MRLLTFRSRLDWYSTRRLKRLCRRIGIAQSSTRTPAQYMRYTLYHIVYAEVLRREIAAMGRPCD